MARGILLLVLVGVVFVIGVIALDAVIWGAREGIVKRGYVGEEDENSDDI